jgi:hypothetical protein
MKTILNAFLISLLFAAPISTTVTSSPTLVESQITTNIVEGQPIDDVSEIDTSFEKLYYYTYIEGCTGCQLVHEWIHDGQLIHHYETEVRASRMKWWTQKPSTEPGDWTARTILDGQVVQSHTVNHYQPSVVQKQMAPLKSRVQKRIVDECEENLRYFTEMAENNPNDPYYQFMLRKWGTRCVQ